MLSEWIGATSMTDEVKNPAHYNKGGMECIDYIRQQLGDNFRYYCEGNVHKYIHRYSYKDNPISDLNKGKQYLEWLIEELEK